MRRLWTLVFLAAVAVSAAAQETPKPARPTRPPRDTVERGYGYGFGFGPDQVWTQVGRHGRLGVVVDLLRDPARDSIGARISGVTPGGAADKAGVRTGDLVVQFNGTRLAGAERADREGEEAGETPSPGSRLVEMASRLHTGDTVHLELRREGRTVNATVIAGESGMDAMVRTFTLPRTGGRMVMPFEGGQMNMVFSGEPLGNLELVKMNPGLSEYFGTSEGILVVNAPGDSALGLRAGDVILAIGGRKPSGPSHAFRILGTYDPGESVGFDLMRMKRHVSITGKMPERRGWRVSPNAFDFDQLFEPGMEAMPLLRDWTDHELPELWRTLPQLRDRELLRSLPRGQIRQPTKPVDLSRSGKRLVET